jgi:D-amino-acid dehydrogenase
MRVCVVGAGVVGVASAYFLARQGHEVSLIDAQAHPATGASHANSGQLVCQGLAPLLGHYALRWMPGSLLREDSPVRLRPRLDLPLWLWCLQFARANRPAAWSESVAGLQALALLSREVLHALLEQEPLQFHHVKSGRLIVYRDRALLDKVRVRMACEPEEYAGLRVLDAAQAREVEPALASLGARLAGAAHLPNEEAGDCRLFTEALFARLKRMDNVHCLMSTRARGLVRRGNRVHAVSIYGGEVEADAVVLAAAAGTNDLLRPMGARVPLHPIKGYSMSVPVDHDDARVPAVSIADCQRHTFYARLGGMLRIAAMAEIGTYPGIEPDRVELLKAQVREAFPSLDLEHAEVWAGMRPATPDGKPLIGRSGVAENLWLNVGQGGLGFTLACGSAALLAAQMSSLPLPIDARAFQPG